ncbi:MAG: hypothetical protein HZB83_08860, partial [Deltaproteobacteria bacterium]|nr:hypothetical protein [Deltaproteobacteria bacterium]
MADFIPIALLFMLSAGYFSAVLDGARLLTERDLSMFFIPPRLFWVDALKNWELPLWNPYYYSGHPLLATLQPGVFYPLNVLLLILPFDLAFNWTIVMHFFLTGVFSYMLLKEMKTSSAAAMTGSLTLMLSGYLFSVHNVMSTLFSVAWAPLAVFLFLRAARRGSFAYAVLTGLA